MPIFSIIVAIAQENAIGQKNDLLTYISRDLIRFKSLTSNHTVIMGRKTYDSLPNGPLPNRRNIVLSTNKNLQIDGVEVFHSVQEVLNSCKNEEEVFVIGGATIYKEFLPYTKKLYLTHIHHFFENADTFFPDINMQEWKETYKLDIKDDDKTDFNYTFLNLERK